MNTVTIKFGEDTKSWKDMTEIVNFLGKRGYAIEPEEEIGTVKLTKSINETSKRQFNCDYCYESKDIEKKSIYQFDEAGDTVACLDCEKKAFEQLKN